MNFEEAIEFTRNSYTDNGIGTYYEKYTHRVVKNYINSNFNTQEVSLFGFIADVFDGNRIYEVQSKNFYLLRDKLLKFSKYYPVVVVYPIISSKIIYWVDKQTKEIVDSSKSTKHMRPQSILLEIYKIRDLINIPNISFRAITIEEVEYKYLDGRGKNNKNGATKINRIPSKLISDIEYKSLRDFVNLVPFNFGDKFNSRDFAIKAKIKQSESQICLLVLTEMGILSRSRVGRGYVYTLNLGEM